jgi:hypothetical protein
LIPFSNPFSSAVARIFLSSFLSNIFFRYDVWRIQCGE